MQGTWLATGMLMWLTLSSLEVQTLAAQELRTHLEAGRAEFALQHISAALSDTEWKGLSTRVQSGPPVRIPSPLVFRPGGAAAVRPGDVAALERPAIMLLDSPTIDERWARGDTAIGKMIVEGAKVDELVRVALLVANVGLSANPWSDEDFRNWADWLDNVGSTVGLGAATIAALNRNTDASHRVDQMGWSLLLSSASKLLGTAFGGQTGMRFEEKVKYVEFTRRAYDNLRNVAIQTSGDVDRNAMFLSEVQAFRTEYKKATTPEEKKAVLQRTSSFLIRYDQVLGTIEALITRYGAVVEAFCPRMTKAVENGTESGLQCNVEDDKTAMKAQLPVQARGDMIQAARQLKAIRSDEKIAQESRVLTAALREALLSGL
jgi:hypothetical protein